MSNSCQKCGNKSTKGKYVYIQAHHKRPFALFPEERFAIYFYFHHQTAAF